jgi:hypothetical protein
LVLEPRAWRPGLNPGGPRLLVDLQHSVEAPEVDRDGASVVLANPRLDAAGDAGPAPEGDRRRTVVLAKGEHRLDVGFIGRMRDEVWWMRKLAPEAAHDVAVGLAESVREAVVALVAEDRGQRIRRLQARRRELDLLDRKRV